VASPGSLSPVLQPWSKEVEIVIVLAALGVLVLLQIWVLPRLGVRT
jgi:hypothetical protein